MFPMLLSLVMALSALETGEVDNTANESNDVEDENNWTSKLLNQEQKWKGKS